jgi:hypothetical protein
MVLCGTAEPVLFHRVSFSAKQRFAAPESAHFGRSNNLQINPLYRAVCVPKALASNTSLPHARTNAKAVPQRNGFCVTALFELR